MIKKREYVECIVPPSKCYKKKSASIIYGMERNVFDIYIKK
jgi:hypothetical protein